MESRKPFWFGTLCPVCPKYFISTKADSGWGQCVLSVPHVLSQCEIRKIQIFAKTFVLYRPKILWNDRMFPVSATMWNLKNPNFRKDSCPVFVFSYLWHGDKVTSPPLSCVSIICDIGDKVTSQLLTLCFSYLWHGRQSGIPAIDAVFQSFVF